MELYFLKTFSLTQFFGIVFSKYFLWGNSVELYSHTLLWGNYAELYSQNISFEATLQSCILKTLPLWGNFTELYSQNISFEAILRNCFLKIFPLRRFYWIVSSKYFFWGNSAKLYSQNTSFEAILLNFILKTFPFEVILRNCILTLSLLGQLCRVAFSQMFKDIISPTE